MIKLMEELKIALVALTVWNAVVFIMYGIDKARSKRGLRRVSEKTLLLSAAAMGAVGALAGMYAFRHKTKHARFTVGVPALLILNITIGVIALRMM